jgi:hypothetical protein
MHFLFSGLKQEEEGEEDALSPLFFNFALNMLSGRFGIEQNTSACGLCWQC